MDEKIEELFGQKVKDSDVDCVKIQVAAGINYEFEVNFYALKSFIFVY